MAQVQGITIPNTQKIDFVSKVNNRRYSISVGLPFVPAPDEGYPVFYVLDGYGYFASAVEATRGNGNSPNVVVVGIGYPDDPAFFDSILEGQKPLPAMFKDAPAKMAAYSFARYRDLSLPATDEALAARAFRGSFNPKSEDVGGLDDFLKTIELEVKPRVGALAKIDSSNQAIFGHSLGGLAVVHALFTEPNAFRTFIAASPSIWWNSRSVLEGEAAFSEAVTSGKASPRVLITMGAEESDTMAPERIAKLGLDPAEFETLIKGARMVENAAELTQRLQGLRGSNGFEVEPYALFEKQGHGISPWPALGRAIAFAFQ